MVRTSRRVGRRVVHRDGRGCGNVIYQMIDSRFESLFPRRAKLSIKTTVR